MADESIAFDIKSPADELFKAFMELLKDDAEVEIEAKDLENISTTIKMISSDILKNYKSLKIIAAIIPNEDGGGSHVIWTLEYKKIRYDIDDPDFSILKMVDEKLLK